MEGGAAVDHVEHEGFDFVGVEGEFVRFKKSVQAGFERGFAAFSGFGWGANGCDGAGGLGRGSVGLGWSGLRRGGAGRVTGLGGGGGIFCSCGGG
ncbi:MAG TPA: hypothetical protein DHU26_00995 [Spirochaetaceae bacterium]|nr:hypothetical protein [Spirochaetaceae bacterium]